MNSCWCSTGYFLVPAKIINFVQEYKVAEQQSVTLHCQAEGFPAPTFTWSPCYNDCNTGTLTIPELLNDTVYTCTATNSEGSDSADASVGKLPLNSKILVSYMYKAYDKTALMLP